MKRRKFRDGEATREALAIEPKAWGRYFECYDPPKPFVKDGLAYVWVSGPLEHHSSWWWQSYDEIVRDVKAALESEETRALVLCIDSPGGDAAGMVETHKKIRSLGAEHDKRIFAYANECAASAAYGIACAADAIYLPKTGHVGSVGVIAVVVDQTARNTKEGYDVRLITTGKRKGDGHPDKPLDDDSLSALQSHVDTIGESFFEIVAETRAMSIKRVAKLEAGVFYGADAIEAGLADGVASFDEFVSIVRASVDGLAHGADSGSSSRQQVGRNSKAPTEAASMDKLLVLTLKVEEKKAALLAAKTEKDRAMALAAYDLAVEAASKYKKTVVEEEEEEEEESEESDAGTDAGEEDDESTDGSTSAEKDSEKCLEAKTGLYTYPRLYRLAKQTAQRITGKTKLSVEEVFGAINGAGESAKRSAKLETRLAKLEGARRTDKIKTLLTAAMRDGRVTPAEAKALEGQDPKWLKGYLATKPKNVRTVEDGEIPPNLLPEGGDGSLASLSVESRKIVERTAARLGKTPEEIAKAIADAEKKKTNGASSARY